MRKLMIASFTTVVCVLLLALPAGSADPPVIPTEDEALTVPVIAPPDCPGQSWRAVRLHCKSKSSGTAVGSYGGTPFSIECDGSRTTATICTDFGNGMYEVQVSGQSQSAPVDCLYSGNKVEVTESCGDIQLTIN